MPLYQYCYAFDASDRKKIEIGRPTKVELKRHTASDRTALRRPQEIRTRIRNIAI